MITILLIIAIAAASAANAVENNTEVNKDEIMCLLDDFLTFESEKAITNDLYGLKEEIELETKRYGLTLLFLDKPKEIIKWEYGLKHVEFEANTLKIKAPILVKDLSIEMPVLIVGYIGSEKINQTAKISVTADISNTNWYVFSFDEDSVTLEGFDVGPFKAEIPDVKLEGLSNCTVTMRLRFAFLYAIRSAIKNNTPRLQRNLTKFLVSFESGLKKRNLRQTVDKMKSLLSSKNNK